MEALAQIETTVNKALAGRLRSITPTDEDRTEAKKAATRVIAGFDVFDEAEEKRVLDERIKQQRAEITRFRNDRINLRSTLKEREITPLAIVPSRAWKALCNRAGLFRLSPDSSSRVGYDRHAWDGLPSGVQKRFPHEDRLDTWADEHWDEMLLRMFPDRQSVDDYTKATLVMPIPPEDVSATLVKAHGLTLHVAAEAAAISFKEKPSQLRADKRAEEERRARELAADPIVYTEQGSASAIIAQFGEFPIEKAVVDAVVESDDLIPEAPTVVERSGGLLSLQGYNLEMLRILEQQTRTLRPRDSSLNEWSFLQNPFGRFS